MAIFETADQLYACIGGMFMHLREDKQTQKQLGKQKFRVQFTFSTPTATIGLTTENGEQSILLNQRIENPDVELIMSGDVAHYFWMGDILTIYAILSIILLFFYKRNILLLLFLAFFFTYFSRCDMSTIG